MLVGRESLRVASAEEGRSVNNYDGPVREYLRYCKRAAAELKLKGSHLDPKYHPTEAGCLRLVFHRTPAEAQEIRQAYRAITDKEQNP